MPMEDIKDKAADIVGHLEDMADTFYKLAIVNLTQKATNLVSAALVMIAVTVLGLFVLLFGGIALSWWLGNLLESRVGGFLLGAAFFLIIMVILVLFRKKIIFPLIRNRIIRKMYD